MEAVSRFRLQRLGEVASTNQVVKQALEAGEPEGLAVTADAQRGGYGRQGRSWSSPRGGMYLSVLLRPEVPPAQLPTLSLAVAVAVRRALAGLVPVRAAERIKVKWPNDICFACAGAAACPDGALSAPSPRRVPQYASSAFPSDRIHQGNPRCPFGDQQAVSSDELKKVVGISLEQHAGGVCVGIGVNVAPPAQPVAVGGKNAPCYLADLGMAASGAQAVEAVRQAVLRQLDAAYGQWLAEGFEGLRAEYERHAALTGRTVAVEDRDGGTLAEGVVLGTDAQGRLLVQGPRAEAPTAVASGEAHVRYQLSSS